MVKSCLVATCKNTQGIPGITFHKIGKKRYTTRLKAIGRSLEENLSPQNVICSKHFAVDDFIFFNGKKYLKLEALPRLFLPRRPCMDQNTDPPVTEPANKTDITSPAQNLLDTELQNNTWLMCSDNDLQLILSSQEDTLDMELNQSNLSLYPTDDFLSSLISDGNDSLDFDSCFDLLES